MTFVLKPKLEFDRKVHENNLTKTAWLMNVLWQKDKSIIDDIV